MIRPLTIGRLANAIRSRPELRDELAEIMMESRTTKSGIVVDPSVGRLKKALQARDINPTVIREVIFAGKSLPKPKGRPCNDLIVDGR